MNECHRCSVEHDDPVLDREIEIARCVHHVCEGSYGGAVCSKTRCTEVYQYLLTVYTIVFSI